MKPLPVDFDQMARQPSQPAGGAPLQISASGLMKNFVFACLDADDSWVENESGQGGYAARKLKLPPVDSTGTFVLGCVDGEIQWLATESC